MIADGSKRYLIVNADDFGQSPGLNRGIIEAHKRGVLTSASLMVCWPAAAEAAAYARQHPDLSLGLHFDLGEWCCSKGKWIKLYEVVPEEDAEAAAREAARQVDAFRRLVGANPTHFDSHQHVHRRERLRPVFIELAERLGAPLRDHSPEVRYDGRFYGQTENGGALPEFISVSALVRMLEELPPGFTELGCHPGYADDLDSMYRHERAKELQTLCDPRIRATLDNRGIELRSFRDVALANNGGLLK